MTWGGSPRHERTPSLGELHQELESEQEGQVNRLLNMIRAQQAQIAALQSSQPSSTAAVVDDSTPTSERSLSFPSHPPHPTTVHTTATTIPIPRTRSPAPTPPPATQANNTPTYPAQAATPRILRHYIPCIRIAVTAAAMSSYSDCPPRATGTTPPITRPRRRVWELERLVGEMNTSGGGAGGEGDMSREGRAIWLVRQWSRRKGRGGGGGGG
ncbi:hypothetical protein H2199_007788 [Coniosporium tulheliwenetii]|uniref:Uncharacterized protein n=1 Tax=Coniosporium tulheliwenetii TaxID=3383036 RepID=A0ACC2YN75_9PEZI|nr:hypothetical protein H2199_007788 [Cladosporium sp. JES 115]